MALEALIVLSQEGSSMKKLVILSAVFFLAAFILLPGASNGKYNVSKPVVADGGPIPPFPPNPPVALMADGGPIPPLPPNPPVTLMADGGPIPPLPPNPPSELFV